MCVLLSPNLDRFEREQRERQLLSQEGEEEAGVNCPPDGVARMSTASEWKDGRCGVEASGAKNRKCGVSQRRRLPSNRTRDVEQEIKEKLKSMMARYHHNEVATRQYYRGLSSGPGSRPMTLLIPTKTTV